MSFKTKFSIIITLIIMVVFLVIVIVDEISAVRNMEQEANKEMRVIATQFSSTIAEEMRYSEQSGGNLYYNAAGKLQSIVDMLKKTDPQILEVSVFVHRSDVSEGNSLSVEEQARPYVAFGDYNYRDESNDAAKIAQAVKEQYVVREVMLLDREVLKSYYSSGPSSPYVVGIVYDCTGFHQIVDLKRMRALQHAGFIFLFAWVSSYLLSGVLLRPLRDILWKVNEVSQGRFDSVIQVHGKDEFSLLGLKINAMSQNLTIYMDKLRKAFEDNRRMNNYLQSFINHTSDAIHVVDLEGRITQVNHAFEQLFGYTSEEAVGGNLQLIPDSHRSEMKLIINSLLSGRVLPAQETVRVTRTGEIIPVSVTVSPIRNDQGAVQAFASITRDMRSRNRMEELLRHSEKLTTVGQLAAGVAHEIRNPLTTLRGFLQLQQQSQQLKLEHTALMLSELDRINLIVGEFLILAKPQATRFATKDVRNVLKDVMSLLDSEANMYNVVFTTSFTDSPCLVSCEENQLKQVFINLLKNGIEAMPSGGRIHSHIAVKNEQITIAITDEGIGIPEDMIPKIGNPFFTGKESGTGLGMMISQRIIHSHQGLMDIQSQVNVGTTVTITLPALNNEQNEGILNVMEQS
ncbi:PAS domain S-box protein [Paenibacillus sp. NEAU-GSW1]|uniref:PAS domain S-box protein n=1 Tax=Paenibacillus sp. NEAU-GSW1 TaxID=2682486 RepID=UPI0012E31584|nr:PAS domain S-box protein [Paenibacillus sp. NEAU-GSW1]MUT67922.1 PAS domain S-box protein [Paenibacillus sp. NEAU-GSW1]